MPSSCTWVNGLDVCGGLVAAPSDVNTRTDGAQSISPAGLAATVGGGALLVYTSSDTDTGASHVRRTRVGSSATARPTCDGSEEPRVDAPAGAEGASFDYGVTASPTISGEEGIVVWREVRAGQQRLWAAMVSSAGCIDFPTGVAPPVLVADPGPDSMLGFVNVVALGPSSSGTLPGQRYVISWWEVTRHGTSDFAVHIFGVVLQFPLTAYGFQPTTDHPDGMKASLPPDGDLPSNHTLVRIDDGRFGLVWYESSGRSAQLRFAILDDTFRVVAGPVNLATAAFLPSEDNVSLAAAYDGSQILAAWVFADEKSGGHAYAAFVDTKGRQLRSERSPDGKPFRLSSRDEASEADLSMTPLKDGGFLVAWTERNMSDRASGTHVRGIGLSADGKVLFSRRTCDRGDFALSTDADGEQFKPQLAALDDHTILFMYTNLGGSETNDRSATGIRGVGLKADELFVFAQ